MARRPPASTKSLALAVAAAVAVLGGLVPFVVNAWPRVENDTIDTRFGVRGSPGPPSDIVVVAIDDHTFDVLRRQWPFPRRWDAKVISILHADGARAIAYDVQFTEPTDPTDDWKLFDAVRAARNVVLATTEVAANGQTNVLGGTANLRAAHAVAASANLPPPGDGVVRRYADSLLGLPTFAVATARVAGHPIARSSFAGNSALIDFRGPPGTIRTVSFSSVLDGRVSPRTFAGKVVVVGASAPTLQDLHQTSTTSSNPMAGVELQADAIWTAMHGNPLKPAPGALAVLAIVLVGLVAPLARRRRRVLSASLLALGAVAAYLLVAQLAFDRGLVLVVSYPVAAGLIGTIATLVASYVVATAERNAFWLRLQESQLELIQRLAQAVESRDAETGEHTVRIGMLCHRLALELGWTEADARTLRYASVAHDIGKIGIPDRILLKPGPLGEAEWETMRSHTAIGARLLAGSSNPLVQMAETIACSHHEWWDGSGYPNGLAGEEIPLVGRICAVVDVYDALVSQRPYKLPWPTDEALREIERASGTQFDPAIVTAFLRLAPRLGPVLTDSYTRERTALSSAA